MHIPDSVVVTGQEISLAKLTDIQKRYFLSVAEHLKKIYLQSHRQRYIVSFSGPSGSGKSVLASVLVELLKNEKSFTCHMVDLDAFHYSNAELREKNLTEVKGRYDTYNTALLSELLQSFKHNEQVTFPLYSRIHHEPQTNGPIVQPGNSLLILPGLWMQRNDAEWSNIRNSIDYTITIQGNPESFKENTINRHMQGGRLKHDAEVFYNHSDLKNTTEIITKSVPSDLSLPYYEEIQTVPNLL